MVHTDAVQALAWLDVAVAGWVGRSGLGQRPQVRGPEGRRASLVVRDGVALAARQLGGGQERERRSGTPDVAGIVGMGVAARLATDDRDATAERVGKLRDRLAEGLVAAVPGLVESGVGGPAPTAAAACPASATCASRAIESESLLYLLERGEVYASAASSCASGAMEPSHVLAAMGVARDLAQGALRLSLGCTSTDADVDAALEVIPAAVERLRMFAA